MGYCCREALVGLAAEHSWFLIYPSHYFKPLQQLFERKTKRNKKPQLECGSYRAPAAQGNLSICN